MYKNPERRVENYNFLVPAICINPPKKTKQKQYCTKVEGNHHFVIVADIMVPSKLQKKKISISPRNVIYSWR